MRYRKIVDDDYAFGHQQADFFKDVPDAPAQAAMTRLQLYTSEWFLDVNEGTAWRTRVLGRGTAATRDPVIRSRILGTQGVTGIVSYSSVLDRDTRTFKVNATIDTVYGRAVVQGTL